MVKRVLISLLIVLCSNFVAQANDFQRLKEAIISQLLSDNPNDSIVSELAVKYFPDGVDTDQCLMELVAHSLPKDNDIESLLSTIKTDGSWDGIYYTSPARSAWEAQAHIKNMMKLARSYKSPKSKFYGEKRVLETINSAMNYWCDNGFTCPNWWYNAIGVPKVYAPILLLLEDDLSPELMAKGIKILEPAEREMTGQNKVWLNGVTFIKGLLLKDEAIVERTSKAIRSELRLSHDEGVQYDYSFQQHGAMQQFGNYGLAFASSLSYWMRIFSGTKYDFSQEQKDIMRNYMTLGLNATIWRGYMDVSSCGRQLFGNSQPGKAASLLISNLNMMNLDREACNQYESYIARNYVTPEVNNLKGHFAYPISKYTIHRGDDFMFSVKMFSTKIVGGEVTNNENLKGYHLADGATMIYVKGDEYHNIFPFWDGKYMPGTTVELNDKPLKVLKNDASYLNGSDMVGCIGEGMFGVSALEYRRDGVEANKSWFFMDDVVVCLGNGLEAQSGDPLVTTLNQCNYRNGAFYINKGEIEQIQKGQSYSASKVYSDGVGYESLDGSQIEFIAREQRGDWHDVALFFPSTDERGDVFTAQIKHNTPQSKSYAYVVKPAVERDVFWDGETNHNFSIIQNNASATAVESTVEEIVMVVFWAPGSVNTKLGSVTSSAPSIVMVHVENGTQICSTHDPLGRNPIVTVVR